MTEFSLPCNRLQRVEYRQMKRIETRVRRCFCGAKHAKHKYAWMPACKMFVRDSICASGHVLTSTICHKMTRREAR